MLYYNDFLFTALTQLGPSQCGHAWSPLHVGAWRLPHPCLRLSQGDPKIRWDPASVVQSREACSHLLSWDVNHAYRKQQRQRTRINAKKMEANKEDVQRTCSTSKIQRVLNLETKKSTCSHIEVNRFLSCPNIRLLNSELFSRVKTGVAAAAISEKVSRGLATRFQKVWIWGSRNDSTWPNSTIHFRFPPCKVFKWLFWLSPPESRNRLRCKTSSTPLL